MSLRTKALIALVIASFFWASTGVAVKTLLKVFEPISLASIRLVIASVVIFPFFIRVTPKLTKKLLLDMLPVSLFSAGNFFLYIIGISKTTANASAIIYTATPLLVAFLSYIFIHERISGKKIIGILLGLTGVLTILILPAIEHSAVIVGDIQGNIYIFGAMSLFALFNVGSRYLTSVKEYNPITVTGSSLFISTFFFLTLLYIVPHAPIFPSLFIPKNFIAALYLAVFTTVITYVLHQWAIKHTSATTGSLTAYIQPIFGFIMNGIFLGEVITGGFLFGSVLVFAGTFLATGTQIVQMFRKKH